MTGVSHLVQHGVCLGYIDDFLVFDIVLRPSGVEVRLQVLCVFRTLEASELFDNECCRLICLVFLDHTDTVVSIFSKFFKQILEVLVIRGSIQLSLSEAVAMLFLRRQRLLKIHLGHSILKFLSLRLFFLGLHGCKTLLLFSIFGTLDICFLLLFVVITIHDSIDLIDRLLRISIVIIITTAE